MNKIFHLVMWTYLLAISPVMAQWEVKQQRSGVGLQGFVPSIKTFDRVQRGSEVKISYTTLTSPVLMSQTAVDLQVRYIDHGSLWMEGNIRNSKSRAITGEQEKKMLLQATASKAGFRDELIFNENTGINALESDHYRYQHLSQDLPVWGNELTLHRINDRWVVTGRLQNLEFEPAKIKISELEAWEMVLQSDIPRWSETSRKSLALVMPDDVRELIWYPFQGKFHLVWHITWHPTAASRKEYFIGAGDGRILHEYESICKAHHHPPHYFDGKSVGTGMDLFGVSQNIQTYQIGNIHTLIDVTRVDMFDPRSKIPEDPIGTIITLDAANTFPGADDFRIKDLISNSTTWNNPDAVSAHTNAAKAYEFFRTKFGRISINGQGGNIISLINVADEEGQRMDNAFWNGKAIFYGRGNTSFSSPLAKALDVAAHELGHGVIETTANLEYQDESGALNESFADIFGAIVEREDWLIGEDVVNKNIFKGGLRNMADPRNGGTKLGDPGYQPPHYDQRYTGAEDNGGVHINSGIPNRAFVLFTEFSGVGLERSEKVYYEVLTKYLTRSSRFVDLRIAVINASQSLYGSQVAQAAAAAFDQVGIMGEQGGDYIEDVEVNPGEDFILATNVDDGRLRLLDNQGRSLTEGPLSMIRPANPPSVTDDGSLVVYVAEDKTMRFIEFDWISGNYGEGELERNPIWKNVAISKDGTKVAAILDAQSDSVFIFSLVNNSVRIFELYNPTTSSTNLNTSDILFADALEWDHSGDFLMYDAFNSLRKTGSTEAITYWDIGFMEVWNSETNSFSDGRITKLFSGLPEKISIGNPTFAKNSPYVIAFDYLDESGDEEVYNLLAVNLETNDIGVIYENTVVSYPSFSRQDDQLIFNAEIEDIFDRKDVIGVVPLSSDKITAGGEARLFAEDFIWGEWFSNGERSTVAVLEGDRQESAVQIFPNPVNNVLYLEAEWLAHPQNIEVTLTSIEGRIINRLLLSGGSAIVEIPVQNLTSGLYIVRLKGHEVNQVYKFIKN